MGKVKEAVKRHIRNGDVIACDVEADFAIITGECSDGGPVRPGSPGRGTWRPGACPARSSPPPRVESPGCQVKMGTWFSALGLSVSHPTNTGPGVSVAMVRLHRALALVGADGQGALRKKYTSSC